MYSNPAAMVGIGTFTSGTVNFQGIDIVGNTAFLASGSNGVMIANITNPANITKISNVNDLLCMRCESSWKSNVCS